MADYTFGYSDGTVTAVGNGWISQNTLTMAANTYPASFTARVPGTGGWGPWRLTISDDNGGYFVVKVGVRQNGAWIVGPYDILQLGDYYGNRFPKGTISLDDYGGSWTSYSLTDAQKLSLAGQTLSFQATYGNYTYGSESSESSFGVPFGFSYTTATTVPSYSIAVQQTGYGTVSTSAASAKAGTTVTVTVSPNSGYFLSSISASTSSGAITLTPQSSTTYTFTMPSANVSVSAAFNEHNILWSNADITAYQNDYSAVITRAGTATSNAGQTVTYYLYKNGTNIGTFPNTTKTVSLTETEVSTETTIRFELYASAALSGVTKTVRGDYTDLKLKSLHKTVKYLVNNAWVECIPYYNTGAEWKEVEPYYLKDGAWILCSHT